MEKGVKDESPCGMLDASKSLLGSQRKQFNWEHMK